MRAFFAIPFSEALRYSLKNRISLLEAQYTQGAVWTTSENWHITLRFFTEVSHDNVTLIGDYFEDYLKQVTPFTLIGQSISGFPVVEHPKMAVVNIESTDAIKAVVTALGGFAVQAGEVRDEHDFRPHVTLARFRNRPERLDTNKLDQFEIPVNEFVLYESRPSVSGSNYQVVRRFPLI